MNTTDDTTPLTGSRTLDADRIDRFRTFLVVEAAADAAHARADRTGRAGTMARRLAIGGLAVAMLVGAMVAFDAGTSSKENRADAAVSITTEDGWTTIQLNDPKATADEVLGELQAAGISAQLAPSGADPYGDTMRYPKDADVISMGTKASGPYAMGEPVAAGTLVRVEIVFEKPKGLAEPDGDPLADASLSEALGVRKNAREQTVSFRRGVDLQIILMPAH